MQDNFCPAPSNVETELCSSTVVSLIKVVRSVHSCNFPLSLCSGGGGDLFQPFTMWRLTTARDFLMYVIFYNYTSCEACTGPEEALFQFSVASRSSVLCINAEREN